MKLSTSILVVVGLFIGVNSDQISYENYRIYSVQTKNDDQLRLLQAFEANQTDFIFLTDPSIHADTDIVVSPQNVQYIETTFTKYGLNFKIKTDNLQRLINHDYVEPNKVGLSSFGWEHYYDLSAIYAWLDEILEEYPAILTNIEFGKSYENRMMRAIKLSHKQSNPTIFIEANIHAREWVTSATATFILNELLTSNDPKVKELAKNYNWVFVPVFNVDGFEYTHTTNRLWRKTRKPYGVCIGADPNRNFDFHHGESGSSDDPCSDSYAGPKPFSESETLALAKLIKTVDNLKMYISFHSFSQLLLFPYGNSTTDKPSNYKHLNDIAFKTVTELKKRYGTVYTYGDISNTIYPASGSTIDWVYDRLSVPLTYTYEFRDRGKYKFLLPANEIIPNSLEVLDSLIVMVKSAKALGYL